MKYHVILKKQRGGYVVKCLELQGCMSEGKTKEEALKNIKEAIEGYLEAFPEEKLKVKREVIEVSI
ncbi:MAG: type II toxin-antitoxin system HicB family antitoxin [archaeon]|nr:type II toxin-antitoxin system HicB family antitoxin [archaeon]MCP8314155.1 type II toxin-antitoxin system HicB family antitoxin [archaeon]